MSKLDSLSARQQIKLSLLRRAWARGEEGAVLNMKRTIEGFRRENWLFEQDFHRQSNADMAQEAVAADAGRPSMARLMSGEGFGGDREGRVVDGRYIHPAPGLRS